MSEPAAIEPKGKQRQSYNLNALAAGLNEWSGMADADAEELFAELVVSLEDDGVIDANEAQDILIALMKVVRGVSDMKSVHGLLDQSGSEAALLELERINTRRKKARAS